MKGQRLFTRILFPAAFILLLPLLSCLVFRQAAEGYAYERAAGQLADLQKNVIPLMDSAFQNPGEGSPQEQVRGFLRQVGPVVRRMGGDGELLILASEYRVIYPREEGEREAAAPVAEACTEYIRAAGETGPGKKAVRLTTGEKESFLANFYRVPSRSRQIEYLITYCSISDITGWVDGAARTILEESGRLTRLVNGLLTLSRLESAPEPPVLSPLPMGDALAECMERMEGFAMERGIVLSVDAPEKGIKVLGEEGLLDKVLDNLVSNAIRYAKGQVTARVCGEGDRVLVSVLDDGPGIALEDLPHLFERCYKGKGGNFGIGLSIAQAAAQAMGGELRAGNRSEGGAVFTLILKSG